MDAALNHEASPADDATVIARVLDGEKQQFALLVTRYQTVLYRHAAAMVLDHDVAADMVQDTFVRAYTHLAACRDRTRFRAWLFQTLRHRCLDHLKDVRRRSVPLDEADAVMDSTDGPGALIERAQVRSNIAKALNTLPDAQREAFLMHYIEELPYEEMARLLDASVSALKMRVLRAREAIGVALRDAEVTERRPVRLLFRRSSGS